MPSLDESTSRLRVSLVQCVCLPWREGVREGDIQQERRDSDGRRQRLPYAVKQILASFGRCIETVRVLGGDDVFGSATVVGPYCNAE